MGERAQDQVCLTPNGQCADNFSFVLAKAHQHLGALKSSGIVGLSPFEYDARSDLFIRKMQKSGVIDEAVFSMSIGMGDQQSKITFGGYDL